MAEELRPEAENHGSDVEEILANEDITALPAEVVNEEGIWVQAVKGKEDFEPEEEDTVVTKSQKKKFAKDTNMDEARFLSMFVCTNKCRRRMWDAFFKNDKKREWCTQHMLISHTYFGCSPACLPNNIFIPAPS